MAKEQKKRGANCKPEDQKLKHKYFLSFTDGQHAKLQEQSKKMLGIFDVHTYLKATILKQIN